MKGNSKTQHAVLCSALLIGLGVTHLGLDTASAMPEPDLSQTTLRNAGDEGRAGLPVKATTEPADSVVERLHGILIRVMENGDKLGYTGRYELLKPIVEDSFDFLEISRIVLGRFWRGLDDDQRSRFVQIFRELSTATYASRFDSYSGESFRRIAKEPLKGERVLLKTELIKQNGEVIPFVYVLHPKQRKVADRQCGGRWGERPLPEESRICIDYEEPRLWTLNREITRKNL